MAELTGLDYTNAIKLEFERLQAENAQLKAQLAEAMELTEILKSEIPTTGLEQCSNCINGISNKLHTCIFSQTRYLH